MNEANLRSLYETRFKKKRAKSERVSKGSSAQNDVT